MRSHAPIAVLTLAALLLPEAADGHALLLRTSPPRRAVLREAPKQLKLWFNERLEPAYSSVTVSTKAGKPVEAGKTIVGEDDARRLAVELPPLPAGAYTVRFRVLSVDGHVAEDSFVFSVGGK